MKRNLVLGGEGFIGKPLCEYLRGLGEEVVSVDKERATFEDLSAHGDWNIVNTDGYDAVYFLAWDVGGAKWLGEKRAQIDQCRNNTAIMENVFYDLQQTDTPFVFASSRLATEDTVYGVQKRLGELWTDQLPNGRYVRLYNVYGAYEECTERSHVVADFIHQALDKTSHRPRGHITMVDSGNTCRSFVHIDRVCKALRYAIDAPKGERIDVMSANCTVPIHVIRDCIRAAVGVCEWPKVNQTLKDGIIATVELFKQQKGMT